MTRAWLLGHGDQEVARRVRGDLLRERAHGGLRRAPDSVRPSAASREALVCFERALVALTHLPESQSTLEQAFEIRFELRTVLKRFGEVRLALARLREADALAERLDDDSRRGLVCAFMTNAHSQRGELNEGLAYGWRVVELATENLAALPADWVYENLLGSTVPVSVYDRVWVAMRLVQLGRFHEAAQYGAESIELAEATQDANTVGLVYGLRARCTSRGATGNGRNH